MAKIKRTKELKTVDSAIKDSRTRYFLQMLDIKSDTNMTRIYSIIKNSSFINK